MTLPTVTLTFNGDGQGTQHVLDIGIDAVRGIRNIFSVGESLDVTALASADELYRHPILGPLLEDETYTVAVANANDSVPPIDSLGVGQTLTIRKALAEGGATGTADDVTIFASNAPFDFRVVDGLAYISTAQTGNLDVRTATEGDGTKLTGTISHATAGVARAAGTTPTETSIVSKGGSMYVRRGDRAAVGEIFVTIIRTA